MIFRILTNFSLFTMLMMPISKFRSMVSRQPLSRNLSMKKTVDTNFLVQSVTNLKGVGPITLAQLEKLKIKTMRDMLFYLPKDFIDRRQIKTLDEAAASLDSATLYLKVQEVRLSKHLKAPHIVICTDTNNREVTIYNFNKGKIYNAKYMKEIFENTYKVGHNIIISGKVLSDNKMKDNTTYNNKNKKIKLTMSNPFFHVICDNGKESVEIQEKLHQQSYSKYGLTKGLTMENLYTHITTTLYTFMTLCNTTTNNEFNILTHEWIDKSIIDKYNWPGFLSALQVIHRPQDTIHANYSIEYIEQKQTLARQRLAFEELVILQLSTLEYESKLKEKYKRLYSHLSLDYSVINENKYYTYLLSRMPFNLTTCQLKAIDDIHIDMTSTQRMIRLIQGDVGSGKTIVGIMGIIKALESNKQVLLLAPTEILVNQHLASVKKYLDILNQYIDTSDDPTLNRPYTKQGIRTPYTAEVLVGSITTSTRTKLFQRLQNYETQILIGTHAILNIDVAKIIPNLALVIIDEEQRFGVNQRGQISEYTNVMYTTATPIPRSLMIVSQEDVAISTLRTKLPTKRPIYTKLYTNDQVNDILQIIDTNIPYGTKVFWVTPALDKSDEKKGQSAVDRYKELNQWFPNKVGLIHGKLKSLEKEEMIRRFSAVSDPLSAESQNSTIQEDHISILVSTTVIEVGIDIPDASICIIEGAHRFGLSQIHQIRGRIGRGNPPVHEILQECLCILMTPSNILFNDITDKNIIKQTKRSSKSNNDKMKKEYEFKGKRYDLGDNDILEDANNHIKIHKQYNNITYNRLKSLENTNDCFEIADLDLEYRGPGDIFGFHQHGNYKYWVASILEHMPFLALAQQTAKLIWKGEYKPICNISTNPKYTHYNTTTTYTIDHPHIKLLKEIFSRPLSEEEIEEKEDRDNKQLKNEQDLSLCSKDVTDKISMDSISSNVISSSDDDVNANIELKSSSSSSSSSSSKRVTRKKSKEEKKNEKLRLKLDKLYREMEGKFGIISSTDKVDDISTDFDTITTTTTTTALSPDEISIVGLESSSSSLSSSSSSSSKRTTRQMSTTTTTTTTTTTIPQPPPPNLITSPSILTDNDSVLTTDKDDTNITSLIHMDITQETKVINSLSEELENDDVNEVDNNDDNIEESDVDVRHLHENESTSINIAIVNATITNTSTSPYSLIDIARTTSYTAAAYNNIKKFTPPTPTVTSSTTTSSSSKSSIHDRHTRLMGPARGFGQSIVNSATSTPTTATSTSTKIRETAIKNTKKKTKTKTLHTVSTTMDDVLLDEIDIINTKSIIDDTATTNTMITKTSGESNDVSAVLIDETIQTATTATTNTTADMKDVTTASIFDTTKISSMNDTIFDISSSNVDDTIITIQDTSALTAENIVSTPSPTLSRKPITPISVTKSSSSSSSSSERLGHPLAATIAKMQETNEKMTKVVLEEEYKYLTQKFVLVNSPTTTTTTDVTTIATSRNKENDNMISSILKDDTSMNIEHDILNNANIRHNNNMNENIIQSSQEPLYIILDIETTGLVIKTSRTIQIAAKVMGRNDSIYNAYIKPIDCKVPSIIEELTGITQAFLNHDGMSFIDAWSGFKEFVHKEALIENTHTDITTTTTSTTAKYRPVVFIAHNGKSFDFTRIRKELKDLYITHYMNSQQQISQQMIDFMNNDNNTNDTSHANSIPISTTTSATTTTTTAISNVNEKQGSSDSTMTSSMSMDVDIFTAYIDEEIQRIDMPHENNMNLHWFNSIYSPTDIAYPIEYCYLDSLEIFRSPHMWSSNITSFKTIKESQGKSIVKLSSVKVGKQMMSPSSSMMASSSSSSGSSSSMRMSSTSSSTTLIASTLSESTLTTAESTSSLTTTVDNDTIELKKLPQPTSKKLEKLHEYILNKPLDGGHNAIEDVKGLEEILKSSYINPYWKEIGQSLLFNDKILMIKAAMNTKKEK